MSWHLLIDPATHLERNVFKKRNLTERAGRAFARQLGQTLDIQTALENFKTLSRIRPPSDDDAKACWRTLDTDTPERREELLGLILLTLAPLWLEQAVNENDGADDEALDMETFIDTLLEGESKPYCLQHEARDQLGNALTRQLRLWEHKKASRAWCAEALLSCFVEALREPLQLQTGKVEGLNAEGQFRTCKVIWLGLEATEQLQRLVRDFPKRLTVQPLTNPPCYRKPDGDIPPDWEDYGPLVRRRRYNSFLSRWDRELPPSGDYVTNVERLQQVAWRLNPTLSRWLRHWLDRGCLPVTLTEEEQNLLQSPLFQRLSTAGEPIRFYLPWRADYRGRVYPRTPYFNFQGGDLQRALFEFADGTPLNDQGVLALQYHGGNLVKRKRLLEDLGIGDRRVVTLEERAEWVTHHEADILKLAQDPLGHQQWWLEVADDPWLFLAFALAWRQYRDDPQAPLHLPVEIDGSCNGLQHIAALTGDRALAKAVNVLPREDGLPGDIYTEIAAKAREPLRAKLRKNKFQGGSKDLLRQAQTLLQDLFPPDFDWLGRDVAKKVIMTVPYGAGEASQAKGVVEKLLPQVVEWLTLRLESGEDWPQKLADFGNLVQKLKLWKKEKEKEEKEEEKKQGKPELRRTLVAAYKTFDQARKQEAEGIPPNPPMGKGGLPMAHRPLQGPGR